MSLNKYDIDEHRRSKRMRALKIDIIIIVMSLLLGIWLVIDHPQPALNAPAFHKAHGMQKQRGTNPVNMAPTFSSYRAIARTYHAAG
jgi:hypothetical protein